MIGICYLSAGRVQFYQNTGPGKRDGTMTEAVREKMICNLRDAGCTEPDIAACLSALELGRRRRALWVLERHRQKLLDQYHRCKECIDCLDYLMIQLERQTGGPYGTDGT